MSPSRCPRVRVSRLALISISIVFVAVALMWTLVNKPAPLRATWGPVLRLPVIVTVKGGITPEAVTIVVNSTSDVANGSDGLCTLREAIRPRTTMSRVKLMDQSWHANCRFIGLCRTGEIIASVLQTETRWLMLAAFDTSGCKQFHALD